MIYLGARRFFDDQEDQVEQVRVWRVVDRSLCPVCLNRTDDDRYDHKYCDWDEIGGTPE